MVVCIAGLLLWPLTARQTKAKGASTAERLASFDVPREIKIISPVLDLRSLRVMSWNIDRGYQLDQIGDEIAKEPADLCLLQEVDWGTARVGSTDVGAELARRLGLDLAYAIEFEELSQEHSSPAYTGQATLTRLPLRRSRVLRFENQSGFWKPHSWIPSSMPLMQRRLGSRVALVTDLQFAGQLLVVYNAHLESRSYGRIQMNQLDEILADLQSHYPPDTPAIIGGDLNTKYFPSIFLHKLQREGFHSAIGERIERSHTIAMALDWIFVRGPIRWERGTIRRDWKGSDHYPILAELVASH
ncbi:MAG: endonuclease/exonuclease/phosphatase family protein [Acidobacteriaceae bacterium]|nr:endonuclease/exonuclease/phosphatase family protein [Acidobacteriaceae bacterium]